MSRNKTADRIVDHSGRNNTRASMADLVQSRSLGHVTIIDPDKQGESATPLPEAIAVWKDSREELTTLAMTVDRELRPLLHKK